MPTYDYRCLQCDHRFEVFQKMSDVSLTQCPLCGGIVERLMGAGMGLIFKGSGFYITDYKKSNLSTSATSASEKSSESKPESGNTEKKPTEIKPAESQSKDKKSIDKKASENKSDKAAA